MDKIRNRTEQEDTVMKISIGLAQPNTNLARNETAAGERKQVSGQLFT